VALLMSRRDLIFCLFEWLEVEQLCDYERFAQHDRASFEAFLDVSERVAGDAFAPLNRVIDSDEPYVGADGRVVLPEGVAKALAAYAETGLPAAVFDDELGGMQLPFTIRTACSTWFQAASAALNAYPFLAEGNANLVTAYGTPEQIHRYARPVIEGRWLGTMCLSEPHAGSSLADITTSAARQSDGTYRLKGTKMWISGGEHELSENIVHLVLARTPGAPRGVRGISIFIVPRFLIDDDGSRGERNDISLIGLNHKLGNRGTTNTLLAFGDGTEEPLGAAGAVGYLVGDEGRGLHIMFHLMNEARIGVGAGAMALGYTGYLESLAYARTREQGRPLGHKDPTSPPTPIIEHPDVRRMLLAQKSYVEGALGLILFGATLVDTAKAAPTAEQRAQAAALLDFLTPVIKSWPSQWCLKANDLAIQVLGGAGYTKDFPVEQHYRDNRLNAIHEGTHGIQGLDLLGRKVIKDDGRSLALLEQRIRTSAERARAHGPEATELGQQLAGHLDMLMTATQAVRACADETLRLANATLYLEATGHLVIAWIWLEQVLAANKAGHGNDTQDIFYRGKWAAARYFYRYELPMIGPQLELVASIDTLTANLDPNIL
jgi:alkylation response protein AidB-like acyl-CoA dehydrogenase